jgi:Tfp pilus assembly protein FimV
MTTMTFAPTRAGELRRHSAAAGRPRSTVRLTRRGRLVVFLLGLAIALAAGFLLANGSTATERPEPTTTIQVGPGETLWDIAQGVADKGHTAEMVDHIMQLNGLRGGALQAGQELRVPVAS